MPPPGQDPPAQSRLLPRRSRSTHNNFVPDASSDGYAEPVDSGMGGYVSGGGSVAYRQAAAAERAERAANREREDEKRRMQVKEDTDVVGDNSYLGCIDA